MFPGTIWRGSAHRFPWGWCSAQRIINPMIAGGNHTAIPSSHQSALRNRLVTDEECGQQRSGFEYDKTLGCVLSCDQPESKSERLRKLSGFCPNSSPDPLRGPPGGELPEGQERPPWGVPQRGGLGAAAPAQKRTPCRGDSRIARPILTNWRPSSTTTMLNQRDQPK